MRARCAALFLLLIGCGTSSTGPAKKDMGSTASICPAHPDQCGGRCCGSLCVDTMNDANNCGGCNAKCDDGLLCSAGVCKCVAATGGGVMTGTDCGLGQSCCGATGCKSLATDAFNCGSCGHSCGSD